MPALPWSEALELGLSFMDDTHREFVDLLAQAEAADDAALPAAWDALVAHTETWTVDQLATLPLDGFEMFNLHANLFAGIGAAVPLLANRESAPELLPASDLVLLPIVSEDPAYVNTWGSVLARGVRRVTTMATDCHRNSFPQLLPDGERIDSYRRMMRWFSNHLLVRPKSDGTWDDADLKEALRAGVEVLSPVASADACRCWEPNGQIGACGNACAARAARTASPIATAT